MVPVAAFVAGIADRAGEPIGFVAVATAAALIAGHRDRVVGLAYAGFVAAGIGVLVVLRLASRAEWLAAGPYFPSGHAGTTAIVAGCCVAWIEHLRARPHVALRLGALLLSIGVGFGRWHGGAHPPLDIAVALAIGAFTANGLATLLRQRAHTQDDTINMPLLLGILAACHLTASTLLPRASDLMHLL